MRVPRDISLSLAPGLGADAYGHHDLLPQGSAR